ncbi:MAG: hypothetical protein J3K34DRAFT_408747 [Monoraphidium minutum]|nr:MAG: hypothetical protein J3K34DRAFT_408747 [Monoraphidium minutum]
MCPPRPLSPVGQGGRMQPCTAAASCIYNSSITRRQRPLPARAPIASAPLSPRAPCGAALLRSSARLPRAPATAQLSARALPSITRGGRAAALCLTAPTLAAVKGLIRFERLHALSGAAAAVAPGCSCPSCIDRRTLTPPACLSRLGSAMGLPPCHDRKLASARHFQALKAGERRVGTAAGQQGCCAHGTRSGRG